MKERPILMSAPMVRAILEDRKTQTRRMVKPQPSEDGFVDAGFCSCDDCGDTFRRAPKTCKCGCTLFKQRQVHVSKDTDCPYGKPGDRLWVRETHFCNTFDYPKETEHSRANMHYRADDEQPDFEGETVQRDGGGWRPSIFMPRWASRITLEVTGVRVERLQDISEEDAIAEGCKPEEITQEWVDECNLGTPERELAEMLKGGSMTAKWDYLNLWESINGKKHPWVSNPWVWVVEFQRVK